MAINKLDKTRRLIKLSPDSENYKSKMKRDNLGGNPDIYQSVGMDWKTVQTDAVMNIDIDKFFDEHLKDRTDTSCWDKLENKK